MQAGAPFAIYWSNPNSTHPLKTAALFLLSLRVAAGAVVPATPATVTVDTRSPGFGVSPRFAGVSIFAGTQMAGHRGVPGNLFSGTNTQLITLFTNSGIRHLRLGATGSSTSGGKNLPPEDIDALFAFAKATDIKVIYSLHGNGAAATAKYVWDHYRPWLDCFAFDNEPDKRAGNDDQDNTKANAGKNYFQDWREVVTSVRAALPEAMFAGPDAAGRSLATRFIKHEKDLGCIALVTQHTYIGGNSLKRHVDTVRAFSEMLSKDWPAKKYPDLMRQALDPVVAQGYPFRITELNDYVHGATNASDAFGAALWALDCMHWFAAHGAAGINFQNTEWLRTDTFYPDAAGNYQVHPKAYAIRAFDLGSHGRTKPVTIDNPKKLNLTAYAIGDATNLCVTIINKECGTNASAATVTIRATGFSPATASTMLLTAPNNDPGAMTGVTLGGGTITNNAPWHGEWTALPPPANDQCQVTVPPASVAVVRISNH